MVFLIQQGIERKVVRILKRNSTRKLIGGVLSRERGGRERDFVGKVLPICVNFSCFLEILTDL